MWSDPLPYHVPVPYAAVAAPAEDDPAARWSPSRDPRLGPHPRCPVPPLFDACLDVLTNYIDCVESLWGVPDAIKVGGGVRTVG